MIRYGAIDALASTHSSLSRAMGTVGGALGREEQQGPGSDSRTVGHSLTEVGLLIETEPSPGAETPMSVVTVLTSDADEDSVEYKDVMSWLVMAQDTVAITGTAAGDHHHPHNLHLHNPHLYSQNNPIPAFPHRKVPCLTTPRGTGAGGPVPALPTISSLDSTDF